MKEQLLHQNLPSKGLFVGVHWYEVVATLVSRVAFHYTHPPHRRAVFLVPTNLLAPFAHNQTAVDPVTRDDGFGSRSLLRTRRGSDPLKVQSTTIMTEVDVPTKFEEVNKKL
jgi:hypothetical protein